MSTLVSVDGLLMGPSDAKISVLDRGFLYGDSVYEVVRTYDGIPFELDAHLDRLVSSAERISMSLPLSTDAIRDEALRVHRETENADSYLRIVVTRGTGPITLATETAVNQSFVVIAKPVQEIRPPQSAYDDGVKIALVDVRRNLKQAIDPQAKTGNYLNSVLAMSEARARGAYEAVMLDHRDYITEGSTSNIFVVVGGLLLTPPVEAGILEGVTRRVVMTVARAAGIRVLELPLTMSALFEADEIFITSSIRELVPVVDVDEHRVGDGRPGVIAKRLHTLFQEYVSDYVKARS